MAHWHQVRRSGDVAGTAGAVEIADRKFVEDLSDKEDNYSRWYTDVVRKAALADYAPVGGCMIIRPYGFALWENMQAALDRRFKDTGHENAYFPLLIPESFMKLEASHVEGFAPEVAWVTIGGQEELEERLAIRPTSEAVIGHSYSKWVQSYRDLPLLINQWCNVLRWEKRTRLFLRTAEFLWQEGHTVHATHDEAQAETEMILEVYRDFVETELAIPVIKGQKSEAEKFAGALRTYSIEAMMGDGQALQAGTSHNLGQNFAKAFNITFLDRDNTRKHAWQTSWGVSTRLIGAIIMVHGDEAGLKMPPRVAPIQAVIVPIPGRGGDFNAILDAGANLQRALKQAGVRVKFDTREEHSPGFKYNDWELRGVPLRLELGPRDVQNESVRIVRRDDRSKTDVPWTNAVTAVQSLLDSVQQSLFQRALEFRLAKSVELDTWDDFVARISGEGGFVHAGWCGSAACEAHAKAETKATIRNIPFDRDTNPVPCVVCGQPGPGRVVFARAY